jgi:hypothetical protein
MTFEYHTTIDDVIAFNLYHFQHSPSAQRQAQIARAAISVGTGLITLLVCAAITRGSLLPLVLVLSVVAGAFLFAIYPGLVRATLRKNIQGMLREGRNQTMVGPQRQTFTPEQIVSSSSVGTATLSWATVERIAKTDTHIFVYLSAVSAIMLPRRIFPNDAAYEACFTTLSQYQQGAGSATAARESVAV